MGRSPWGPKESDTTERLNRAELLQQRWEHAGATLPVVSIELLFAERWLSRPLLELFVCFRCAGSR